jgi:outer membrane protein assembly factor BamB
VTVRIDAARQWIRAHRGPTLALVSVVIALLCSMLFHTLRTRVFVEGPSAVGSDETALQRLMALGYIEVVQDPDASAGDGVTLCQEGRTAPGLNLFAPAGLRETYLMGMNGNVFHTWSVPVSLAPNGVYHVELLRDGGLLAVTFKDTPGKLLRLDFDSRVLWSRALGHHHDVDVTDDGTIYALTQERRTMPRGSSQLTILDNYVSLLSGEGEWRAKVSLFDLLESGLPAVLNKRLEGIPDVPDEAWDVFHSNTIEVLRVSKGPLRRGDVLLCSFSMNRLLVVDANLKRIVWTLGIEDQDNVGQPLVNRAHMPTQLDNGNLLVFVNGGIGEFSSVVELDPATKTVVWKYVGNPPAAFHSSTRGGAHALENGNVLVTESNRGRAFEVTRQGEIVWEYRAPRSGGGRRAIYRMMRVPSSRLAHLPSQGWWRPRKATDPSLATCAD